MHTGMCNCKVSPHHVEMVLLVLIQCAASDVMVCRKEINHDAVCLSPTYNTQPQTLMSVRKAQTTVEMAITAYRRPGFLSASDFAYPLLVFTTHF